MARKRIAVDVMGGDLGSGVAIKGAVRASKEFDIPVLLVGREDEIQSVLKSINVATSDAIQILHAPDVITMEDSPSLAIRGKRNSSVRMAFEAIKDGKAFGMMGPGNTGALMAAGLSVCGTIAGIQRPAIATAIPRLESKPFVLLDSGANIECNRNQLITFALMGSIYARVALKINNPRVALISNGEELCKGTDTIRSTAISLAKNKDINFVGYVEGRNLENDVVDVAVCDGFIGNIVLKSLEGMLGFFSDTLKISARKSLLAKIGLLCAKSTIKSVMLDKYNTPSAAGAPLLGLNYPALVLHGASKEDRFYNAVKAISDFVEEDITGLIKDALINADFEAGMGYELSMLREIEESLKNKR